MGTEPPPGKFHDCKQTLLEAFERDYVVQCLEHADMNVSLASRISGLSRKHLRTLMAKYGIAVRRQLDQLGGLEVGGQMQECSEGV
jgi:DNA-binding NtrC family response regulator